MKRIKYVALAFMVLMAYGVGSAQEKDGETQKTPNKRMAYQKAQKDHFKKWSEELDLTENQINQIKEIRSETMKGMKDLRGEMQKLREEERNEIAKVYTPEQKEKLEKMKKDRRENWKKRDGKPGKKSPMHRKGKHR